MHKQYKHILHAHNIFCRYKGRDTHTCISQHTHTTHMHACYNRHTCAHACTYTVHIHTHALHIHVQCVTLHPPLHRAVGHLAMSLITSSSSPEAIEVVNNLVQLLIQLLSTNMSVHKMVASLIVSFWTTDTKEVG